MSAPAAGPLDVLYRIRKAPPRPRPGERCDMCATPLADRHDHVVDIESRSLQCTCRACWLLFTAEGAGAGRHRAVPDRYALLGDFSMTSGTWDAFQIPVGVAFFFRSSSIAQIAAFYPSPAGATESLLDLAAWDSLVTANELLGTLAPDVEALLLRVQDGRRDAFIVPIDACYELVGLMRRLWRGFDGGREAKDALDGFFTEVRSRCR